MPEPQIAELLDRAVHHAPPMTVSGVGLLAAGKGRVRRRRAAGAGAALGAAAIVAAVWAGLSGGEGSLTGLPEVQPATTVFEQGEVVDAVLLDGFHTIDSDQVAHAFSARLTRGATGPLVLEVTDGGGLAERITADSPVPGLEVFAGETMTVALWREPDGVLTSVPLVGPVDPGGPSGRVGTEIDGERFGYAVYAEGVQGVQVPEEFLDVYLVGRDGTTTLSGERLPTTTLSGSGHGVRIFADEARGVIGYVVRDQDPILTLLGDRPAEVHSSGTATEDGVETVVILPEGATEEQVDTEGTSAEGFGGTRVLGRPLLLVWGEDGSDVGAEVTFTLGGRSYDLAGYLDDLVHLDTVGGERVAADAVGAQLAGGSGEALLAAAPGELADVWPAGGGTVLAAHDWPTDGSVLSTARVALLDEGSTEPHWVRPHDVAQVSGRPENPRVTTLLSLDVPGGSTVAAVGLERDGEVERWDRPVTVPGVE